MMYSFRLIGFLCLFWCCLCDQRLLIDQLRWDFLELENELWNFSANGLLYKPQDAAEIYLVTKINGFDGKLRQVCAEKYALKSSCYIPGNQPPVVYRRLQRAEDTSYININCVDPLGRNALMAIDNKNLEMTELLIEYRMPQNLLYGVEPLRTIPDFLFLYSELKSIETTYDKFREYQSYTMKGPKTKVTMEDIIYDITNNKTGVKDKIDRVYKLAYDERGSIKQELHLMLEDNYWCKNTQQSPQQLFYNLYNLIALNELKAYVLQQFAHLGNRMWEKDNNVDLSISARQNYEKRLTSTINGLSISAKQPQDIWKCDPKIFVKGKNYDVFTRLLQGHIQNEVDMSSRRTCKETCGEYSYTKSYGCYDSKSEVCRRTEPCTGSIIGCFFVESHASICTSDSLYRRYDFVRYDSGKTFGKYGQCSNRRTVNSWTRWFVRCHYCMCLCDQQGALSDRYINLRPVMADVKNNRVVTGLRLVKHNRILHLQIQEGKLLPYGYINDSTVHWVKLDNYKVTDRGTKNREDFFVMTYGDRSMAMDEIQVNDDNHVITGVRFELLNSKIHFEIHVSPFNWHTGLVDHKQGYYIYESNPNGRTKIKINSPDIPITTTGQSKMFHSNTDIYVEFTHTDFYKDAAQTTIPFIDIQEVINKPAVPLMGAGIYYKGNPGYGGFIAPRIKTYNYAKHISSKMPKMGDRVDVTEEKSVELN